MKSSFYCSICIIVILSLACAALPVSLPAIDVINTDQQEATSTSGGILFEDDFSSPLSGWEHLKVSEGIMDYDGGGYRILVNALQTNFWSTAHKDFSDVRLEVDIGKLGGPDENRAGLICRFINGDYYFFIFTSDGYFGVGLFESGQAILLGQDALTYSEKIQKGMTVNHLRADCQGDRLAMYINGFEVTTVHDSKLNHGDIGLLAGTFDQTGVDILFDNLVANSP